jgi:putative spermidine/putrescine transport system ATP-binding protein
MAEVELRELTRRYGQSVAVDRVSLDVAKGELVALLGPSGCGKTTTLRMIAGFVEPNQGTIAIAGRDMTRTPPHRRDVGMVFQSYALFPHLSVAENIAFGLRRRKVPGAEIRDRVARMIALLRLDGLAERLPRQLSGGQQQRVAVGRALVINPTVLLLDEPFSNLDAQLRESTRLELRKLQQELRLTAVFVTHDQTEAMAIADRIAVMNRGRIEQVDPPAALYAKPRTRFVAGFMGRANIFEGEAAGTTIRSDDGVEFRLASPAPSGRIAVSVRPEAIRLEPPGAAGPNRVTATVALAAFLGSVAQLELRLASGRSLLVEGANDLPARFPVGAEVVAAWDESALVAFPP